MKEKNLDTLVQWKFLCFRGGEMSRQRRAVVVIDIESGHVVKRYETLGGAKKAEHCTDETIRGYCDHKKDEAGLYRTFRWAEEVDR